MLTYEEITNKLYMNEPDAHIFTNNEGTMDDGEDNWDSEEEQ